jgi:DNA-directed RNA polymerase specialized sigma24 family protein
MKKRKRNYVNNRDLYEAMIDYIDKYNKNISEGKQPPQLTKYITDCLLQICTNLGKKPNFYNYTYKQDMIADAICDCIAGAKNFDPEKTENPFAYFTQIAWNAYLRRIKEEKKQTYIKHKNYIQSGLIAEIEGDPANASQIKTNEFSDEVIKSFEEGLTSNKKTAKLKGVEKFANTNTEMKGESV